MPTVIQNQVNLIGAAAAALDKQIILSISSADIDGTGIISNFPVLVSKTFTELIGESISSIQFTDIANVALEYEIAAFDSGTGKIIAFVKQNLDGTSGNTFKLVFGTTAPAHTPSDTWSVDYLGVWHFEQSDIEGSNLVLDSTSNANHGTALGSINNTRIITNPVGTPKPPGQAIAFLGGATNAVGVTTNAGLENLEKYTFSCWYDRGDAQSRTLISKTNIMGGDEDTGPNLLGGNNNLRAIHSVSSIFDAGDKSQSFTQNLDWVYCTFTWDKSINTDPAGEFKMYADGVLIFTSIDGVSPATDVFSQYAEDSPIRDWNIGVSYPGDIAKPYLSNVTKSDDYILTEHRNNINTDTFVTVV